jgi:ERCC4-type nuclease
MHEHVLSDCVREPLRSVETAQSHGFLVGISVALLLVAGLSIRTVSCDAAGRIPKEAGELINPNTADVASLLRLPGVGMTRARAIVAYRQRARSETGQDIVFASPDDLQCVTGIGPGIARAIRPWLHFEAD